jgi:hypothetical protein
LVDGESYGDRFKGTIPLDVSKVFEHSLEHFRTKEPSVDLGRFILSDNKPDFIDNESRIDEYGYVEESPDARIVYYDRVKMTFRDIEGRFAGRKILVVTHADAYSAFNDARKLMEYRQIYKIPLDTLRVMDGGARYGKPTRKYKISWTNILKF